MKIAIIGDFEISENYPNTKHLISALEADSRFTVISCKASSIADRRFYDSSKSFGARVKKLLHFIWASLLAARDIKKISNDDCDVIYVPYPSVLVLFFYSLVASRKRRKPLLVMDCFISIYETVVIDRKIFSKWNPIAIALKYVEKRAVYYSDLVISDTAANAKYLRELFAGNSEKYQVVNLCINQSLFLPRPAQHSTITRVLFAGSFVPLQGVEVVGDAAIALGHRKDIRFHIVGDGQTANALETRLRDQVLNLDWDRAWYPIDAIAGFFSAADICLGVFGDSAKTRRVLPYKIYMGMACAKPVISAEVNDGVLQDFSRPFVVVDHNSGKALADKILELADSRELRDEVGKLGRQYYETHLSNLNALDDFHHHLLQGITNAQP